MTQTSKTLTVSIACSAKAVYAFVSDPRHLPQWAAGLARSMRPEGDHWIAETPEGPVKVRFAPKNEFGILDHTVSLAPGVDIQVPMRVVPNGEGSEVIFTLFQFPGMPPEKFTEDIGLVEKDLQTLKTLLEKQPSS